MNELHADLCASEGWAEYLTTKLVPWGIDGLDLSGDVLEIGGGYGASTDYLIDRVGKLTVIELDDALAKGLRKRFGKRIRLIHGDATAMKLADRSFDTVLCFTMLHHVRPAEAQDRLFAEAARVLRPGGFFAGTDSRASDGFREFHTGDVYQPVDPKTIARRLKAAGFANATTRSRKRAFRFQARSAN
ncbi:MAG TPA: class I SAM-dependent methyltransferase [Micromonosporaceae bacterium]|jgi:ubiquinone/menaquinone biosynthesis C-methylase UbiE